MATSRPTAAWTSASISASVSARTANLVAEYTASSGCPYVATMLPPLEFPRIADLPVSEDAKAKRRDEYLLDSAHHGLAMNPKGTKLCVAGTMSDYAAIVNRQTFGYRIAAHGTKPYWSTNSADGRYCYVSFSGDDAVSVISYAKEREVKRFSVGDHPQRMRTGKLYRGLLGTKKVRRPPKRR